VGIERKVKKQQGGGFEYTLLVLDPATPSRALYSALQSNQKWQVDFESLLLHFQNNFSGITGTIFSTCVPVSRSTFPPPPFAPKPLSPYLPTYLPAFPLRTHVPPPPLPEHS